MSPPPSPKPKPKYGEPEKPNLPVVIAKWAFVIIVIGVIVLMIVKNPKQHELSCRSGPGSLIGFGSCEEQ
jgi:hypothetical protein